MRGQGWPWCGRDGRDPVFLSHEVSRVVFFSVKGPRSMVVEDEDDGRTPDGPCFEVKNPRGRF